MKKLLFILLASLGLAFSANASTTLTFNGGSLGTYVYTNPLDITIPPGTVIHVDKYGKATIENGNSNLMQPMVGGPATQPGSFPVTGISGFPPHLVGCNFTVSFEAGVTMTTIVNAIIDLYFPGSAHVS